MKEAPTQQQNVELLKTCPYFERLTDVELRLLGGICAEASFAPGEIIAHARKRRGRAYVVVEGTVGMFYVSRGEEIPIDNHGPGAALSIPALLPNPPYPSVKYVALSPVSLLEIPPSFFQDLVRDHPHIGVEVFSVLADGLLRRIIQLERLSPPTSTPSVRDYFRESASLVRHGMSPPQGPQK